MAPVSDYDYFLNELSKKRKPSAIRALQPLLSIPGMITLGGGNPNPAAFPFASMTLGLQDGTSLKIEGAAMQEALQYSPTPGLPCLLAHLRRMIKKYHNPPMADDSYEIQVTTGSQDGLSKTMDMLISPGDYVLLESPSYSGTLGALRPMPCNLVGIQCDGDGLIPAVLADTLDNWPADRRRPKFLYTIPTGQNPSGASVPSDRKKQIYDICCKHNILILEDDPYYFLYYEGIGKLASYLSMDTERRVLRFDSFSKVLSSGLRVGWVTGPKELVMRIQLHSQVSVLHVSGVSQVMVATLLTQWGDDGWTKHIQKAIDLYKGRCDVFLKLLEKHVGGLATWKAPTAGMFCWIRVKDEKIDTKALVAKMAQEYKVLLVPGHQFDPNDAASPYMRASFSIASEEQMDEALKRLGAALRAALENVGK